MVVYVFQTDGFSNGPFFLGHPVYTNHEQNKEENKSRPNLLMYTDAKSKVRGIHQWRTGRGGGASPRPDFLRGIKRTWGAKMTNTECKKYIK